MTQKPCLLLLVQFAYVIAFSSNIATKSFRTLCLLGSRYGYEVDTLFSEYLSHVNVTEQYEHEKKVNIDMAEMKRNEPIPIPFFVQSLCNEQITAPIKNAFHEQNKTMTMTTILVLP